MRGVLSSFSLVILVSHQHTQTRKITLVILPFEINVARFVALRGVLETRAKDLNLTGLVRHPAGLLAKLTKLIIFSFQE